MEVNKKLNELVSKLKGALESFTNIEGFRNQFHFNDTCLLVTFIFLFAFIYKKELIKCLT